MQFNKATNVAIQGLQGSVLCSIHFLNPSLNRKELATYMSGAKQVLCPLKKANFEVKSFTAGSVLLSYSFLCIVLRPLVLGRVTARRRPHCHELLRR